MLPNDTTIPQYHGDGPVLPDESVHQAMGENTAMSLGGHMLTRPSQGVGGGLHPLKDEPTSNTEKAAFKLSSQGVSDGTQAAAPSYNFSDTADHVRSSVRPGA